MTNIQEANTNINNINEKPPDYKDLEIGSSISPSLSPPPYPVVFNETSNNS